MVVLFLLPYIQNNLRPADLAGRKGEETAVRLIKALNNNVALVQDENGQEAVVMGRGVAFNGKPGSFIREDLIEKHFV